MKVMKKFADKQRDIANYPGVTLAFLGDSVTQGCFEPLRKAEDRIEPVFDQEQAYHHRLARMLSVLYPKVPVNIINAGISGDDTAGGLERLERDVLVHKPDLTVVCFGLNDSCKEFEGVERYKQRLQAIFTKLQESGSEVIFMTANMMNTSVSCHLQGDFFRDFAVKFMERQNAGVLTAYFEGGKEVAKACGVKICDVYSKWMKLYENGVDVTELLANKLNHPVREMNWVFAYELVNTMMND